MIGTSKVCTFENCGKGAKSLGLCPAHYAQHRRGETLRPLRKRVTPPTCKVDICDSLSKARGLCEKHYAQVLRTGGLLPPEKERASPGEWHDLGKGYIGRKVAGVRYLQHRVAMEEHLGRELLPGEEVHHKNTIKSDNSLDNLELWAHSQPSGARAKDLLDWAEQIVALYGPDREKL